jgi:hypothetical protein
MPVLVPHFTPLLISSHEFGEGGLPLVILLGVLDVQDETLELVRVLLLPPIH